MGSRGRARSPSVRTHSPIHDPPGPAIPFIVNRSPITANSPEYVTVGFRVGMIWRTRRPTRTPISPATTTATDTTSIWTLEDTPSHHASATRTPETPTRITAKTPTKSDRAQPCPNRRRPVATKAIPDATPTPALTPTPGRPQRSASHACPGTYLPPVSTPTARAIPPRGIGCGNGMPARVPMIPTRR